MKKITIGIVDDNKDFCEVVSDYLRKQANMEVVFTAEDGGQAITYIRDANLCPDILVLDLILSNQFVKSSIISLSL